MAQTLKDVLARNPSDEEFIEWMQTATNEELNSCRSIYATTRLKLSTAAQSILEMRRHHDLKKPHWTITPGFWIGFAAMVFAAIAAWPVIHDWLPKPEPAHKAASSQSLQSNSTPTTA